MDQDQTSCKMIPGLQSKLYRLRQATHDICKYASRWACYQTCQGELLQSCLHLSWKVCHASCPQLLGQRQQLLVVLLQQQLLTHFQAVLSLSQRRLPVRQSLVSSRCCWLACWLPASWPKQTSELWVRIAELTDLGVCWTQDTNKVQKRRPYHFHLSINMDVVLSISKQICDQHMLFTLCWGNLKCST